jgi:hypothetical protein
MWRVAWEACSNDLESWKLFQHLLRDIRKPKKTCVEMAGRFTFRMWFKDQDQAQLYLKSDFVPRSKHAISVTKTINSVLYREIALCSEIHKKKNTYVQCVGRTWRSFWMLKLVIIHKVTNGTGRLSIGRMFHLPVCQAKIVTNLLRRENLV